MCWFVCTSLLFLLLSPRTKVLEGDLEADLRIACIADVVGGVYVGSRRWELEELRGGGGSLKVDLSWGMMTRRQGQPGPGKGLFAIGTNEQLIP